MNFNFSNHKQTNNPLHIFYICELLGNVDILKGILKNYNHTSYDFSKSWCHTVFTPTEKEIQQAVEVLEIGSKADQLATTGDVEKAILLYLNAAKMSPADPIVLMSIGTLYAKINEIEKAVTILKKAVQITPVDYPGGTRIVNTLYAIQEMQIQNEKVQINREKAATVNFITEFTDVSRGAKMTYTIYQTSDKNSAMTYLEKNPVDRFFHYLIVETPEGNYGCDINGIYKDDNPPLFYTKQINNE